MCLHFPDKAMPFSINEEYAKLGEIKIGVSEVSLTTLDEQGNRIIRNAETNLGDFCADALEQFLPAYGLLPCLIFSQGCTPFR